MTGKYSGIYSPVRMLVEARGNPSARSSVSINACLFCNPDSILLQEESTSGFYAGAKTAVGDVLSTVSGFGRVLKIIPTRRVNCVTDLAESSLCGAHDLHLFSSMFPLFGAASVAPFFRGVA